jgi:hypothetical protein
MQTNGSRFARRATTNNVRRAEPIAPTNVEATMTASPLWSKGRHIEYRSPMRLANKLAVPEKNDNVE